MLNQPLPSAVQLPVLWDVRRLEEDLARIGEADWIPHFNHQYYEGDWSGAPLRGPAGATHPVQQLYPNPTATEYADTPLLQRCPYFSVVLGWLACPLRSVRLLRLGPQSTIREHMDYCLGYEDGEIRLHIPITSNPDVTFILDGQRVCMEMGEVWYLNVNKPHQVSNRGETARIHLVADCVVNDWVESQMVQALSL